MTDEPDGSELPTLDEFLAADTPSQSSPTKAKTTPMSSFTLLAAHCLRAAVPTVDRGANRIAGSIVIVEVPSRQWVGDVKSACRTIWPDTRTLGLEADGKWRVPELEAHLRHHVIGHGLVLVLETPDAKLPEAVITACSKRYVVRVPTLGDYISVAKTVLKGNVAKAFLGLDISNLDFMTLSVSLVLGDTAKHAADKVRKAAIAASSPRSSGTLPRLADLKGHDSAKEWAHGFVADLSAFKAGRLPWSVIDHAGLLFGPPGTGKTSLAQIVANEAGVPLIHSSISNYFAEGSGNLDGVVRQQRKAFAAATAQAPSILFIDELDALPARGNQGRNSDFWRPVITDLLLLLDSAVAERAGVCVIGATNRVEDLDPALLRRMETMVYVPPPDAEGLVGILRYYLDGELDEQDLMPLALSCPNATGADAVVWLKGARRRARLKGRPLVINDLAKQMLGTDTRPAEIRRRIAIHEAGHAVAAMAMRFPILSVSIAASGNAGGGTQIIFDPHGYRKKSDIEAEVVVLLAGRAAEASVFGGELGTGTGGSGASDLARATDTLKKMHQQQGLGRHLMYREGPLDPAMSSAVERDLRRLYGVATGVAMTHTNAVLQIAEELQDRITLNGARVAEILASAGGTPPTPDEI